MTGFRLNIKSGSWFFNTGFKSTLAKTKQKWSWICCVCVCVVGGGYFDFLFFFLTPQIKLLAILTPLSRRRHATHCKSENVRWNIDEKLFRRRRLPWIMDWGCRVHARPVAGAVTYHAVFVVDGTGVVSAKHLIIKWVWKNEAKTKVPKTCNILFGQQGAAKTGCKKTKIDWLSIPNEALHFVLVKMSNKNNSKGSNVHFVKLGLNLSNDVHEIMGVATV